MGWVRERGGGRLAIDIPESGPEEPQSCLMFTFRGRWAVHAELEEKVRIRLCGGTVRGSFPLRTSCSRKRFAVAYRAIRLPQQT